MTYHQPQTATRQDPTISDKGNDVRTCRARLTAIKKIQHVLDREQEAAKEFLRKGQKDRALLALRRRKYQDSLLLKTDGQLQNLEELVGFFGLFCVL